MDCSDARRLIDQGIVPGSRSAVQAKLGFHLAQCGECREYRESQTRLLEELLAHTPDITPNITPDITREVSSNVIADAALAAPNSGRGRPRRWWFIGVVMLIAPLVAVGWVVNTLVRTNRHLDAMIVTSVPTSVPTLTATTISATPTQSHTPLPYASETAVPTEMAATTVPTEAALPVAMGERGSWRPAATATVDAWPTIAPAATPHPTMMVGELSLPAPIQPTETVAPEQTKTILLLGHDLRPGEDDIPRTDAIMLMRVTTMPQRVALLSLPRDLWVAIPGYGMGRINEAYRVGEAARPGSGLGVARETVTTLTGIPIDYSILVGFEGFMGVIDTIGGVTINVETELYDPEFPTMDHGYTTAHFLVGPQHMDGETALTYSRTRHPDSDFMRIRRQQSMIIAIVRRLHERGNFQNLTSLEEMTGALVGFVFTDMPKDEIVGLLWEMRAFDIGDTEQYALDAEDVQAGVGADLYALRPIVAALEQIVAGFLGSSPAATP